MPKEAAKRLEKAIRGTLMHGPGRIATEERVRNRQKQLDEILAELNKENKLEKEIKLPFIPEKHEILLSIIGRRLVKRDKKNFRGFILPDFERGKNKDGHFLSVDYSHIVAKLQEKDKATFIKRMEGITDFKILPVAFRIAEKRDLSLDIEWDGPVNTWTFRKRK